MNASHLDGLGKPEPTFTRIRSQTVHSQKGYGLYQYESRISLGLLTERGQPAGYQCELLMICDGKASTNVSRLKTLEISGHVATDLFHYCQLGGR